MGGGSRLVRLGAEPVLACLDAVGGWGDAVLIIDVPAYFLSSYGYVVWVPCGVFHLVHRRLLFVLRWLSFLPRPVSFDSRRAEREAGRLLAWLSWRGSLIDVYNEYDVCDVYKRYKDTRI